MEKVKCNMCKEDMELVKEQIVAGTKYRIYKCKKCNREVAKSES